jgi:hypothetical protein
MTNIVSTNYDFVNHFLNSTKQIFRDHLVLKDGSILSIQASELHYCFPRNNNADHYETVEIWLYPKNETFFAEWGGDDTTPAAFVPVEKVNEYILKRGGIL